MKALIILYWGTIFLMYLSQVYYPAGDRVNIRRKGNFMLDRPDIFLVIIIGWLSAFMFLRTSYNDTGNYIIEWRRTTQSLAEFLESGELPHLGSNPLYDLYRTLLREITDNYHIFFFFPSVLSCIGAVKLIKRYSVTPWFSLVVFFSIGTYVMYMAALKQCFAVAIVLLALPYAIDKKYIRFYLLVILAMLFHVHAFIFLAVPFFLGKPWGKVTWLLLAAVLAAMATYNATFSVFMRAAISLGVKVVDFELFDGHSIHPIRIVVYAIPAVISFFFRRQLYRDSSPSENLFANMSITSVLILMIGLVQGANLFARMAAYYEIATCIALPWMLQKIFNKRSQEMVFALATILFFLYFLYEFGVSKSFGSGYAAISLWQFFAELLGLT